MHAATSSFGMSGVNAHAIFSSSSTTERKTSKTQAHLHRQRFWPFPWPHIFAAGTTCSAGRASFATNLQAASLSYLNDHQVFCEATRLHVCFPMDRHSIADMLHTRQYQLQASAEIAILIMGLSWIACSAQRNTLIAKFECARTCMEASSPCRSMARQSCLGQVFLRPLQRQLLWHCLILQKPSSGPATQQSLPLWS